MAKLNPLQARLDEYKVTANQFRLMGLSPCLEMTNDAFLCVIQTPKIMRDPSGENEKRPEAPPADPKAKTPA